MLRYRRLELKKEEEKQRRRRSSVPSSVPMPLHLCRRQGHNEEKQKRTEVPTEAKTSVPKPWRKKRENVKKRSVPRSLPRGTTSVPRLFLGSLKRATALGLL